MKCLLIGTRLLFGKYKNEIFVYYLNIYAFISKSN